MNKCVLFLNGTFFGIITLLKKKMVFCVYAENDLRFSFLENNCIDSTYYSDVGQIVPNIRFD